MQNSKNVQEEFTDKNMEEQFMKIQILSALLVSKLPKINYFVFHTFSRERGVQEIHANFTLLAPLLFSRLP